jgi:hypothetical protein
LRQKSLRLKVYSLGTGTQEGAHINPNKGMARIKEEKNRALEKGEHFGLRIMVFLTCLVL